MSEETEQDDELREVLFNLFFSAITGGEKDSYDNLLMLEFIFHHGTTLDDYLLLYRREIIRQQAFQHAKDFEKYVTYFKTAILLKTNIGKNIPYILQIIKDDQKLHEESLVESDLGGYYSPNLFSSQTLQNSSEQDFFVGPLICKAESIRSDLGDFCSPPHLKPQVSSNSGLQDYFVGQVMTQKDSIRNGIEEYYTNSVGDTLQYLIKAEKIIYKYFILTGKLKHLSTHFLSPLIDLERTHKTSLFYDKDYQLKEKIHWNDYARRLLSKLITENIITINVAGVLQSNCKMLLLHKVRYTHEDTCEKQYLDQLNMFVEKLECSFDNDTIRSTELSLSLERISLVKVLWYICKSDENLIHPFLAYLSNIHSSSLLVLLQQPTKNDHNSALMIAIIHGNFVAFEEILKQIQTMNHEDIFSLLSFKNNDGNTCLMLAAKAHPSYVDALLDVQAKLSIIKQTSLLKDTNQQEKNALMIAICNPEQTLSTFCAAIESLDSIDISKILLQKAKDNLTTLGLLIKYKSNHLLEIAPLFEDLKIADIYQMLSHNILPRNVASKKCESQNIKTSRISRVNKLRSKHRREKEQVSSIEINSNNEKNIFQYALTLRAKITTVGYQNIYNTLFALLNKLPLEKKCKILGRRERNHSTTLHLAFSQSVRIANMFIQYMRQNLPSENTLILLTKINTSKDNALFVLAKHHLELLTSLILSFSNEDGVDNTDDAFNDKNSEHQTLLAVAICTQTQEERERLKSLKTTAPEAYHNTLAFQSTQIMKLVRALKTTLSEANFCQILCDKGRNNKSILTHAQNMNNRPLFIEMIKLILRLKNTRLRDQVIEEIFTFKLSYDVENTCSTVTTLLKSLNNAKNFDDLPALTQTLNPHGWGALSLSVSNHPGKIIENLTLYAEIKQSKLNAGEVSSCFNHFWYYEPPEQKISTVRKLIAKLEKQEKQDKQDKQDEPHMRNIKKLTQIINKMSERERGILNHGQLNTMINAYYREEQKQAALSQVRSQKNSFWQADPSTSRLLSSDTTKATDHPSHVV
ncbi:MAG: hypothetical protein P1U36_05600 [Legionellaceae bacterium]|nr:hypothetical protein [Legionellaceae bacterium]